MQDEAKTKEQLITELKALRQLVAELEKGKGASADPTELRRRAEKLSKARQTETGRSKTNDAERLCQELEIQQIELEMQNHELRNVLVQIEESRTRYSDLYDFAPVGYLTLDENGLVLEANLTFARQLGVERSCLVGSPLSVYIVLPDRNEFRSHLGSVLKYKTHQACEVRFMKGGGGDFHAMLDTISVEDAVGQRRVRTSVTDITERKRGEAALVESEDRFKLLYEQAPLAYQSLDENGNLIEVNPTWLEALGYAKEDVIGRNIADFLHPDWVNHFKESFPRFKAVGEVLGVEFEMVKKDGSTMRVSFHGKIGRDSQGRFKQTHCIFHDITERVKQAREIEYLNRLYSVLSRVSQAVVRATSPETFLDQACREVVESGGFLEAWIGEEEPMTSAVVPTAFWGGIGEYVRGITVYADSRAEGRGLTGTCIREHRPVVHNDFLHDPQTLPWRDRAASFGIASGAAFPIERGGQAWGALTIYSDEVDRFGGEDVKLLEKVAGDIEFALDNLDRELRRKQAEEELKSAFRKIDLILNAAGEGIVGLDENGTVTFVNPAAGQMLGYEEEELIGKDLHPMIHHSFPDGTRYPVTECPMWQCLRSGASSRVRDEVLWKKDGTSFPAAYSTTPIMGNGRVAGAVVTFRDISVRKRAEEALLESENKFKSFAEQALAGIYILQDGVFKYVNPKFAQMFGYTVDECLNDMHFQNLVYSEDLATVEEQVRRRTSGETKSVHYTFRGLKKNGQIFHAEVYGATSVYKGKPARAGTMVDITERKLAEAALKDSETQFRTLVESAPDAIFILVEGRFFVYANDAAVRLYGAASEKELLGRDIMESIHPDHRASVLKRIRLIDEEEKPIPPMELRHVKLDGTTVYVESHAVPIKYRKSKAALVFVRDITERKKNEEALSISEERYKRLFEDASMGIFRVTLEGKLIDVNPAFTLMFGFDSPEEVKSQVNDVAVDLFVDPSRRHEIVRMMLDTKRPVHAESLYGRKDGSTFMADLHAWAVRDKEGKLLYLEGFVEDISERKRAEEEKKKLERQLRQSQKLEALGTLAGGIAHDFNNILQPIIGYIEIVLLALSPSSPQRENLERVFTAALRAKDLVKQILAISRSPEEQRRTPTDISSIVKEALKLLRSSLPTSIEMRQKILKGAALADPTQIHQVLMNLCTNAAHAMDGKGILEVRLSHVDLSANDLARRSIVDLKSGPYLKLTVSDTGCGMDAETLERIFDPYFTTKEVGKGSGLGLAVVDGIVKRHEGAVTVRSETGKGTTFTIYIPRVDVESEATMQFDDLPPLGSERILLVDDDAAVMETGASLLKSLGYKVTSQTDSMKTLEVFRSTPHEFDLLITDYTMPKLTGLDLAGEVRRIRPDMPFLLCTGFSEKITHAGVKELGMELLMKPFNMVQISQAVRKILDEQKGG